VQQPQQPYPPQGQTYPNQPAYPQNTQPGYGYSQPNYRDPEPPPPPERPDDGFKRPEISIRVDPLNMLFESRLGLELETQVWQFISFEIVPVFVISSKSPTLNYFGSFDQTLRQHSNGLGSMSGALFDAAFWFGGKPFRGYGLRVGLSDYSYKYDTSDDAGPIDSATLTDRQFVVMLAEHDRWGAFTLAGGIGVGYELNKQNRCWNAALGAGGGYQTDCRNDQYVIATDHLHQTFVDLHSPLYPFDLLVRFSLGVVF
jgi:hypothetical protein